MGWCNIHFLVRGEFGCLDLALGDLGSAMMLGFGACVGIVARGFPVLGCGYAFDGGSWAWLGV